MSRIIATLAIRGAHTCVDRAETMLSEAVSRHGRDRSHRLPRDGVRSAGHSGPYREKG